MNTKSIVKITRIIKYVICILKYCILTTIKKLNNILNHCKNTFNKSLVENQKSYKNVQ